MLVSQVNPPPEETPAVRAVEEKGPPELTASLRRFIKGGNAWAAGGVALLVTGFATLIAWLAGKGFFTLEMGIIAAAFAGLIMLVSGWLFRNKRRVYCLLLQGGGIGILYLSVFAAHKLTPWFSQTTAFVLLSFLVLPAAILALLQDSQLMALSGFLVGFAAPFLIFQGGGNHVFLFSYYAILSAAVFVIGLFRFWRFLNFLAFAAVFISAIGWVSAFYKPELFWSTEPFFLGFIFLFTFLGLQSFGKKNAGGSAFFDGLLLLGTPLLAAILQWRLFSFYSHGYALVSIAFAAFYLGLGVFIWKRKGRAMRLFSESFLGLAVLLANLAVPLELSQEVSAAVWAAEGALFYFFGHRLKNGKVAVSALILHLASVIAFFAEDRADFGSAPFLRSAGFSGALIIALAGMAMIVITRKFQKPGDRDT